MEYLKNVKFIRSVFNKKDLLNTDLPLIAIAGKSNVGKSSFINTLANNKNTAKVGSTPGKTKCLNYFNVNDKLYLVDLPGYGFSKMSLTEKENINALTNYFLENTPNLKHIFLLLDIRHTPTQDDKMMYKWLYSSNIPFSIVLNKADKLSNAKQQENLKMIEKDLFAKEELIPFSSESKQNLDKIITIIDNI